jgi:hypothetical protein
MINMISPSVASIVKMNINYTKFVIVLIFPAIRMQDGDDLEIFVTFSSRYHNLSHSREGTFLDYADFLSFVDDFVCCYVLYDLLHYLHVLMII